MIVTETYYAVMSIDASGNSNHSYTFFEEDDACRFAVKYENILAYGLPDVWKITTSYDNQSLDRHTHKEHIERLTEERIRAIAKED